MGTPVSSSNNHVDPRNNLCDRMRDFCGFVYRGLDLSSFITTPPSREAAQHSALRGFVHAMSNSARPMSNRAPVRVAQSLDESSEALNSEIRTLTQETMRSLLFKTVARGHLLCNRYTMKCDSNAVRTVSILATMIPLASKSLSENPLRELARDDIQPLDAACLLTGVLGLFAHLALSDREDREDAEYFKKLKEVAQNFLERIDEHSVPEDLRQTLIDYTSEHSSVPSSIVARTAIQSALHISLERVLNEYIDVDPAAEASLLVTRASEQPQEEVSPLERLVTNCNRYAQRLLQTTTSGASAPYSLTEEPVAASSAASPAAAHPDDESTAGRFLFDCISEFVIKAITQEVVHALNRVDRSDSPEVLAKFLENTEASDELVRASIKALTDIALTPSNEESAIPMLSKNGLLAALPASSKDTNEPHFGSEPSVVLGVRDQEENEQEQPQLDGEMVRYTLPVVERTEEEDEESLIRGLLSDATRHSE